MMIMVIIIIIIIIIKMHFTEYWKPHVLRINTFWQFYFLRNIW